MEQEPSFLTASLGLAFVLGVIFFISYLFKRFGSRFIAGLPHTVLKEEITLLGVRVVDPKNRLVLFRCRNKEYLVLTGETNCVVDSFPVPENSKETSADV